MTAFIMLVACLGTVLWAPSAVAAKRPAGRVRRAAARSKDYSAPLTAGSSDQSSLLDALGGKWAGVLEYRDYDDPSNANSRIRLPTWLAVSTNERGSAIFAYTYDKALSKMLITVTDSQLIQFDMRAGTITTEAEKSNEKNVDRVQGYTDLKSGRGVLVTTGPRTEKSQVVQSRTTWLIQRNLLEWTFETRQPGGDYSFQYEYVFTRNLPPVANGAGVLSSAR